MCPDDHRNPVPGLASLETGAMQASMGAGPQRKGMQTHKSHHSIKPQHVRSSASYLALSLLCGRGQVLVQRGMFGKIQVGESR
jgi:hypothetical protein